MDFIAAKPDMIYAFRHVYMPFAPWVPNAYQGEEVGVLRDKHGYWIYHHDKYERADDALEIHLRGLLPEKFGDELFQPRRPS